MTTKCKIKSKKVEGIYLSMREFNQILQQEDAVLMINNKEKYFRFAKVFLYSSLKKEN